MHSETALFIYFISAHKHNISFVCNLAGARAFESTFVFKHTFVPTDFNLKQLTNIQPFVHSSRLLLTDTYSNEMERINLFSMSLIIYLYIRITIITCLTQHRQKLDVGNPYNRLGLPILPTKLER